MLLSALPMRRAIAAYAVAATALFASPAFAGDVW